MRKINLYIVITIISSVIFFSGCQSNQQKAPQVLAEFEYSGDTNEALVPVEFQGQVYQFALDTGAEKTVFDTRLKDKLGKQFPWPLPRTMSMKLANGKTAKGEIFPTPKAKIGPLKLKGSPFVAVVDCNVFGGEIPGLIGMDFLKKYVVQIDYDNKKVTFFKGKKEYNLFSMFKPKQNKHPEWGEPVPLKTKHFSEKAYYVEGSIFKDIKTDFLIDSGRILPFGAIGSEVLEKIDSYNAKEIKDVNILPIITMPLSNDAVLLGQYSIGTVKYKNHIFQKHYKSVLGHDFLSRHIVTFDFPNKIMYLKKGKNFDKFPSIIIFLGSTGCGINPVNYEVVESDPNSLAYERGIKEKDVLIKINNQDISHMNLTEFKEFLLKTPASEDGKRTWTFKRGDEIFTVTFTKQDIESNKD